MATSTSTGTDSAFLRPIPSAAPLDIGGNPRGVRKAGNTRRRRTPGAVAGGPDGPWSNGITGFLCEAVGGCFGRSPVDDIGNATLTLKNPRGHVLEATVDIEVTKMSILVANTAKTAGAAGAAECRIAAALLQ